MIIFFRIVLNLNYFNIFLNISDLIVKVIISDLKFSSLTIFSRIKSNICPKTREVFLFTYFRWRFSCWQNLFLIVLWIQIYDHLVLVIWFDLRDLTFTFDLWYLLMVLLRRMLLYLFLDRMAILLSNFILLRVRRRRMMLYLLL